MRKSLVQEYIDRHSLPITVIEHQQKFCLLLKSKTLAHWRYLEGNWVPRESHPGVYEVVCHEFVKNGFDKGVTHTGVPMMTSKETAPLFKLQWHWDDFESSLEEIIPAIKENFEAVPADQSLLAAWEVFLIVHENEICRALPEDSAVRFYSLVEKCIRTDLSTAERKQSLEKAQHMLGHHRALTKLREQWVYRIMPFARSTSDWLVNLING